MIPGGASTCRCEQNEVAETELNEKKSAGCTTKDGLLILKGVESQSKTRLDSPGWPVPDNVDTTAESLGCTYSAVLKEYFNISKLETDFNLITDQFEDSIYEAMRSSDNCMIPCFDVSYRDTMESEGLFAVIDIGGSTLRVGVVKFDCTNAERQASCLVKKSWPIGDSQKHLDRSFFKWAAEKFASVLDPQTLPYLKDSNGNVRVGITWSFPMVQNVASNRGIISHLGKGFSLAPEFKDKDLKDIFESCFKECDVPIEVCAIVNDSISVFLAGSFFNKAELGLVQGTGVNCCFLVDSALLGKHKRSPSRLPDERPKVLLNSESSFIGFHLYNYITESDLRMNTFWSTVKDGNLRPPHLTTSYGVFQPLEILTSGRYIPELVRRVIVEKVPLEEHSRFLPGSENVEYGISAESLSKLYSSALGGIPHKHGPAELRATTDAVVYRAALILASYIVALWRVVRSDNEETLKISVVGSFLRYFPGYKEKVLEILSIKAQQRLIPDVQFDFVEDSSIYGAAIAALVNLEAM